ncbi:MAG: hypothetical protein V2A79_13245 [Planctomycetota bacterium]
MIDGPNQVGDTTVEPAGLMPAAGRPIALRAVLLAVGCGSVYVLVAGGFRFEFPQTKFAHHILMADAMLHGQLHIREEVLRPIIDRGRREAEADLERYQRETGEILPPEQAEAEIRSWIIHRTLNDWALVDGRVYGYWAPLTPVLMMPFVAVFGAGVSDRLLDALIGGLNIGLFYWLLRRIDRVGLYRMTEACCLGLTLLLAFGTVHFYLSSCGRVWFAAQVVTLTAILAALIAACTPDTRPRDYLSSGIFFGLAILGRNVVGLMGLFFLVLIWQRSREGVGARVRWFARAGVWFGVPVVLAGVVQGAYNYGRFGDVFDSGQAALLRTHGDPRFREDYERYGQFSPHFLSRNFKYYMWNLNVPRFADGRRGFDPDGNSMFLVTPPLGYALLAWRGRSRLMPALVAGAVPMLVGLLLFRATGYYQFGNRYLLEMLPLLLLLVAGGMRGRLSHVGHLLIMLAIAVNLYGTYRYCADQFGAFP